MWLDLGGKVRTPLVRQAIVGPGPSRIQKTGFEF